MNLLLVLILVSVFIIVINLVDEYIKHKKLAKLESGSNYAHMEDYGYRDTYLLKRFFKTLFSIIVVLVSVSLYFSIFILFLQSINNSTIVTSWNGATFKWYLEMFTNRSLNNSIYHTFLISILATLIATILGTLFAVGIYYSSKKVREHILLLNNFPLLNADIVTGISLMLIFSLLISIDPYIFGFKTLLLAHLYFCFPYVVLNVLNKLREMDQSWVDAAQDLGLKPLKTLGKVIIPACKSGIFTGMIFAFTMSFDDFVISYYTSGNGFDNLSVWIYSSIGRKSLSPIVYSFSIMIILLCLLVIGTVIISRTIKERRKKGVIKK